MFSFDKVDKRELPGLTEGDLSLSPLIKIFASPWGNSRFSAKLNITTKSRIKKENTNIDTIDVVIIIIEYPKMLNMPLKLIP